LEIDSCVKRIVKYTTVLPRPCQQSPIANRSILLGQVFFINAPHSLRSLHTYQYNDPKSVMFISECPNSLFKPQPHEHKGFRIRSPGCCLHRPGLVTAAEKNRRGPPGPLPFPLLVSSHSSAWRAGLLMSLQCRRKP